MMCVQKVVVRKKSNREEENKVNEDKDTEHNKSAKNYGWIYGLIWNPTNFFITLMKIIIKYLKSNMYSFNCSLYLLYIIYINQ